MCEATREVFGRASSFPPVHCSNECQVEVVKLDLSFTEYEPMAAGPQIYSFKNK